MTSGLGNRILALVLEVSENVRCMQEAKQSQEIRRKRSTANVCKSDNLEIHKLLVLINY